jgi:hypothetical protein
MERLYFISKQASRLFQLLNGTFYCFNLLEIAARQV